MEGVWEMSRPLSNVLPRRMNLFSGAVYIKVPIGTTKDELARNLFILSERPDESSWWLCIFTGTAFEVVQAYLSHSEGSEYSHLTMNPTGVSIHQHPQIEEVSIIHRPIDPRIRVVDVHKATRAYQNADRTAWLFEHCNPGEHHDHYLSAEDVLISRFQLFIDNADLKEREAPSGPTKIAALNKLKNLLAFRNDAIYAIVEAEKAEHLGHFAQTDPEVGHVHDAVRLAINATKNKWAASPASLTRYRTIVESIREISKRLAMPHTPETRWDKEARLERERKAAEAAANEEQE